MEVFKKFRDGKKQKDDLRRKFNEIMIDAGAYVVKEENSRNINYDINLESIYNIKGDIVLGEKYKMDWYSKDKKNSQYFNMQLLDNKHVYVLHGRIYNEKIKWENDKYNKDRLVIISGLYTNNEEKPACLRDMSEEKLAEIEYLLKKELLPIL
jgi:hypothetical protein